MQKVLVAGAGGFVGSRIMQMLSGGFELCAPPKGMFAHTDEGGIAAYIFEQKPQYIINAAALSDTAFCEANPELSYRANVQLPLWLAHAAGKAGAKLISFSSDQVYCGAEQSGPLSEALALKPANVYGRHKLEAEQRVMECLPDAVFLRATWMYDLPGCGLPIRGNLPMNLLRAALKRQSVSFSHEDFRGVTYVRQAIENLPAAFDLPGGVYNYGSENDCDMVQTARAFAQAMHLDLKIEETNRRRNLSMDCAKARQYGIEFDMTVNGILRCLRDYGLEQF